MILGIGCVTAIAFIGIWAWKVRDSVRWAPLRTGVVGTVLGLLASLAAYQWLFEVDRCTSRSDLACMLNQNQGVLTVLAGLLAVIGLWIAALYRYADVHALRQERARRFGRVLNAALEEIAHNLIHIAAVYELDDANQVQLIAMPQTSLDDSLELLDPEIRPLVHPEIQDRVRTLTRNQDRMQRDAQHKESYDVALRGMVNNSLRVLVMATACHRQAVAGFINQPGLQDIRRCAQDDVYFSFLASGTEKDAASLRSKEEPCLCWFDDGAPEGVTVYPQSVRFRDLAHPPH